MTTSYKKLREKMTLEQKKEAAANTKVMLAVMPLHELRKAQKFTQEQLAQLLDTKQAGLSRLENQTDMYISTLTRYIEAMGGELEIIAKFPSGHISIKQFKDLDSRI